LVVTIPPAKGQVEECMAWFCKLCVCNVRNF